MHILVKPTRAELMTNLVINTDRRTYHLELRANPSVYMAYRIDASTDAGIQELKEWVALLKFLGASFPASGAGIPEAYYGEDGAVLGRINILN